MPTSSYFTTMPTTMPTTIKLDHLKMSTLIHWRPHDPQSTHSRILRRPAQEWNHYEYALVLIKYQFTWSCTTGSTYRLTFTGLCGNQRPITHRDVSWSPLLAGYEQLIIVVTVYSVTSHHCRRTVIWRYNCADRKRQSKRAAKRSLRSGDE